jgi:hypothetical protein
MNSALVGLYLFGSCLYKHFPNDIDLLWIYDGDQMDTQSALEFVNRRTGPLRLFYSVPIHNTLLSRQEERSVQFLTTSKAVLLASWSDKVGGEPDICRQIEKMRQEKELVALSRNAQTVRATCT